MEQVLGRLALAIDGRASPPRSLPRWAVRLAAAHDGGPSGDAQRPHALYRIRARAAVAGRSTTSQPGRGSGRPMSSCAGESPAFVSCSILALHGMERMLVCTE